MRIIVNRLIPFLIAILITSCDYQIRVNGVVLDKATNRPISNVAIGKTDTSVLDNPFNQKVHTDNNGYFEYNGIAGNCDYVTLYFSRNGFLTKKMKLKNERDDTILLSVNYSNQLLINSKEIKFSSPDSKDNFIISISGQSIIEGKVSFKIIDATGNELWTEKFPTTDLIGYGLDYNSTIKEKEEYIRKRVLNFFRQDNFLIPAIQKDDNYDSDYSEKNIWDDIKSDSSAIGFYYLIGEERGCRIAYSKKLKKVVTYFCCC